MNPYHFILIIAAELFFLSYMVVFQAFPIRFFRIHRTGVMVSLIAASFVLCVIANLSLRSDGVWIGIAITGAHLFLFLFAKVSALCKKTPPKKTEVFHLKADEYKLQVDTEPMGDNVKVIHQAVCQDKIILFSAAFPAEGEEIEAYCTEQSPGVYLCGTFERCGHRKRSRREWIECIHSVILIAVTLAIPIVSYQTTMLQMELGRYLDDEDKPMQVLTGLLMLLIFGGCRKLFRGAQDAFNKMLYYGSVVFYYLGILCMIVSLTLM